MESFYLVLYNTLGMVHCIYGGVTGLNFQNNIVFSSMRIALVLANSVDPDEMQHYAAFHLGLHRLPKGAQWLSGRVLDSRPRGRGFEPHRCHCFVVLEQDKFIIA